MDSHGRWPTAQDLRYFLTVQAFGCPEGQSSSFWQGQIVKEGEGKAGDFCLFSIVSGHVSGDGKGGSFQEEA